MNSSTNPPGKAQRFNFDVDFDIEEERLRIDAMRQAELAQEAEQAAPYVPPPTFSEDEISKAREESYRQGFERGMDESKKAVENDLIAVIEQAMIQLLSLSDAEKKRYDDAQEIALSVTVATIKKLWPQVIKHLGIDMIQETIRKSLEYNPEETRIVVRVHDSMLDPVVSRLPQLQQDAAFAGKVIVLADANVGTGDCKIEWADGGLERLSGKLSSQLDEALDRILASIPNNKSQKAESERTES